jgi:tetratricopeptide (TPR) repeat protein
MGFIEKLKKIKLKLIMFISIIILCLVFAGVGVVKYTNAAQVKEGLILGNKYLQEEKYEEAILSFIKVIEIEPKNIEARVGLAKAYIKTGKPAEAEKILKESISINPKEVEQYIELAKLYIVENELENAIKTLTDGYKATNSETTKSMLEELKSKITVNDINKIITLGENYSLPKEVAVKINNVEVEFPVKWDRTSVDTTKVGSNVFIGTLENIDKSLKLTLNVLAIASIENINISINQNDKYLLPSKVTAKLTGGSTGDFEVAWSSSKVDTSKAGSYSYQGTVSGYNSKIELTLNIIAIASIENINSSIKQNDKYSLPLKVTAKMTDGSTRDVDVTWSPSGVDTSKAGSYSYQGTVSGYNNKIKLTLNIKSLQNDDNYTEGINLSTEEISKIRAFINTFIWRRMFTIDINNISDSELVNFGIWQNYHDNSKALKVQGDDCYLDKSYVIETVKKYFNKDIKVLASEYYKFDGKGYTFTPADGEMVYSVAEFKVIDIGSGQYQVIGKLDFEMDDTKGTFTAVIKKYNYKNVNTYSIIKLDAKT